MDQKKLLEKLWDDDTFTSQFSELSEEEQVLVKEYTEDLALKMEVIFKKFNQYAKNPEDAERINRDLEAIVMGKK